MEDNSMVTKVKQKMSKGTKRVFILMAIMLVLSLTSTIVLASFQAQRNSSASVTFANGVTLKLTKTGTSGANSSITNDSSGSATAAFNYANATNLTTNALLDGISCQVLNQAAFLAYSILVIDGSTNVKGSWATFNSSNVAIFTPTSGNWRVSVTVPASTWTGTATSSATTPFKVMQTSTTATAANNSLVLFNKIEIYGSSTASDITALAGKNIKFTIKLSAHTTDRNTDLV